MLDVTNDSEVRKYSKTWQQSFNTFPSNFLSANNYESDKNERKENKNSNFNISTLSLHISTYENSIEATSDSDLDERNDSKIKCSSLFKKWETAKQFNIGQALIAQNPFEFPRQQEAKETKTPEISQFKAFQKLLNPNQFTFTTNNQNCIPVPISLVQKKSAPMSNSAATPTPTTKPKVKDISTCTRTLISYSTISNEFITELVHGKIMEKIGIHISDGRFKLSPEECTYLTALRQAFCYENCNSLEAYEEGKEPMSMMKLYAMLTENSISLLRFSIFSSLTTAGYTVKPSKPSSSIPGSSNDEEIIQHDYDVWHFSIPWSRSDIPPSPTYRLIVADFRYKNQLPPRHQLSKLSLNGEGAVVIATGAVGTFSFFSIQGMPINLEL
uniref:Uncharacterized protein n=1 Tax=Panagrolaimus sp. ES5 TaxID=591445 RepID=A0AC34F1V3_9BILA